MGGLKPCPFCGGKGTLSSSYDEDFIRWHYVVCRDCGAMSRKRWVNEDNECPMFFDQVRDSWNTRKGGE